MRNNFIRNMRVRFDCDFIRSSKNIIINISIIVIIRKLPWTCLGLTVPPDPS